MAKQSIECKKLMVEEISNRIKKADALIVTHYKGLTAQELDELRRKLRSISSEYVVVKDSIVKRAITDAPNNPISEFIKDEVGIAIDRKKDPANISKVLIKFSKDHEVLNVEGGIIDGAVVSREDIVTLAELPSREVLLGKLANVLNAPIQGLVASLHCIIRKIVYALNEVKGKRGNRSGYTKDEG